MPETGDIQPLPGNAADLDAKFSQAMALHQQGRLADAERLYREILQRRPDHFDALHLLGVIALQTQHAERAVELIGEAIRLSGNGAAAHINLAKAWLDLKRPEKALESCDRAIALKPEIPDAHNNRATALIALNRPAEALASCDRAIALKGDFAEAYNNRGFALMALKLRDEALASYNTAISLKPDFADAHNNRGNALLTMTRPADALVSYDRALALTPDFAMAHSNRGNALLDLNRPTEALAAFDRAISLKPDYAEAHNNRGNALSSVGDFDAALASYRRAIELKPDYAECYRHYAASVKIEADDPIIQKAEKLVSAGDISDADLMHLHFALAKAQDDLGNSELSLHHLVRGNAIRKKDLGYDFSRDEQLFVAIRRFFDSEPMTRRAEPVSDRSATPIFILGMPRSGTTLVEQIVSSHSMVFGAGELEILNEAVESSGWQVKKDRRDVFDAVRSFYHQKLSEVSAAAFVTDKMTVNFRWIGFIVEALPEARIVHVKREPAAVCWSNFKTYFPSEGLRFAFDMQDIAKFYRLYDGLMDFWHKKYPGRIYDLNYEALTEHQEEETRKLFGYLQLGWEDNVLAFHSNKRSVTTASDIQVRQAMYQGSSREWEKYRAWLQPLLAILNA